MAIGEPTRGTVSTEQVPHRCPICYGKGMRPPHSETSSVSEEICDACGGTGIIYVTRTTTHN